MNFEMLGDIGQFVSAIAVLITLIYVAIQVRQSRNATLAAMMQANRM